MTLDESADQELCLELKSSKADDDEDTANIREFLGPLAANRRGEKLKEVWAKRRRSDCGGVEV